jgi:putative hemolysin
MIHNFPKQIITPPVLSEAGNYIVKLAENHEEVEKAQRLRYEVFNIEQGRGLQTSEKFGIDFDEFDEDCLHLLLMEKKTERVIGTYRAHLGCIANSAKGFYSSKEYYIKGLYKDADKCLELGRTCVSSEFRAGAAIALLWSAITELLVRAKLRYMLGCVSLEGTDPKVGWAVYDYILENYPGESKFTVVPRPGFRLKRPLGGEAKKTVEGKGDIKKHIPPLFRGYLNMGGVICGEPALDKEFGTIDFFIMVDIEKVPERYLRHFNYRVSE